MVAPFKLSSTSLSVRCPLLLAVIGAVGVALPCRIHQNLVQSLKHDIVILQHIDRCSKRNILQMLSISGGGSCSMAIS